MKFTSALFLLAAATPAAVSAFAPQPFGRPAVVATTSALKAEIRGPTEKSEELRFGWDGTTALGGAVVDSQPARMLDEIRAAGETIPPPCEVFNANVEMDADNLMFEEVIEMIDTYYEPGLLEFKNGDMLNKQGENEGSAKVLSYAALSGFDKETTLKVCSMYHNIVCDSFVCVCLCACVVSLFLFVRFHFCFLTEKKKKIIFSHNSSFGGSTTVKSRLTLMALITRTSEIL